MIHSSVETERQNGEDALALGDSEVRGDDPAAGDHVRMTQHYPFRLARRTGGVKDGCEILLDASFPPLCREGPCAEFLETMNWELRRHFSWTDYNQKLKRRNLWEHFRKRCELRGRSNKTFHSTIASDVHYLFGVQKCIDRDIDSFCARYTEDGKRLGNRGFQIDAHSVTAAQSRIS